MKHASVSLLAACLALSTGVASAQGRSGFVPPKNRIHSSTSGGALAGPSSSPAAAVVAGYLRAHGVQVADASLAETGSSTARGGVTVVRLEQRAAGLPVYGTAAKAAFSSAGALVYLAENFVADAAVTPGAPRIDDVQALTNALRHLYDGRAATPPLRSRREGVSVFERTPFFHDSPTVTRVAFPRGDRTLAPGLIVETWSEHGNRLHRTLVGPAGEIAFVEQRTNDDAYNVYRIDPVKTPQEVVQGQAPGPAYSPVGWLGEGTQTSTSISGNNVSAYLDSDANNRADRGGTSITNGEFLSVSDLTTSPAASDNRNAAVQNLFYLNNRTHDILYQRGFTEAEGNFQADNFGRGGSARDPVNAEAQDGSGTDNANFATPPDGRSPRMQMYLWTGPGTDHEVVANGTTYGAMGAVFGPALTTTGVSGGLVVANDGSGTTSDACEPLASSIRGMIAVVDRGTCTFVIKVANAQAAGAIGVIVANNVAGDPFTMGGTDQKIRIPAVMVSLADGTVLKGLAGQNATIRRDPTPPLMIDGDLDSDVVYHEYGHGLTWRMIGGMSGRMAGAIGEGASDVVALLVNGDAGGDVIAEYAASSPAGIRRYPYTDYPLTYKDVTGGEVHNDGEPFAAILWRARERFLKAKEPSDTLFAYFVDGMRYTPSTPAYEDMRDGMLQSAAGNTGHQCLIWKAFADFGVGVGASGVVNADGSITVVESYSVPSQCHGN